MEQATDLRAQSNGVAVLLQVPEINGQLDGGVMSMGNVKKLESLAVRHTAQIRVQSILLHGPQNAALAQELPGIRIGERVGLL